MTAPHVSPPTTSATSLLADRVFLEAGAIPADVRVVDASANCGLKFTGGKGPARSARTAARSNLGVPVLFDREAYCEYVATPNDPFHLPQDCLFPQTLLDSIREQFDLGVEVAFTPSGHIPVGSEALESAVARTNALGRSDVALSLPLHHGWLSDDGAFSRLLSQLARTEVPVALSLAHSQDPSKETGVPERLRELARSTTPPFLDRTDLAGLDYVARGGLGASIGLSARLRHGLSPSIRGTRFSSTDNRMSIYWPGLLRFVRPVFLEEVFASSPPPACTCPYCNSQSLTSFTASQQSQARARNHNAWWLARLTSEVLDSREIGSPLDSWRNIVIGAIETHERLRVDLRRPNLSVPETLEYWAW